MKLAPLFPHALVVPAGPEDDGEHTEDQEHGCEAARPPLTAVSGRCILTSLFCETKACFRSPTGPLS
ncbi:hypothetical protein [Streptomyces sp. NPDC090080]|uniref:hypothetical protein n=1 Tax=Streptomyces sp. NPDC090080 TaxID=3365939 RepID=UPI00381F88E7